MKIENPTASEVQSVIRFLNAKNYGPKEIHRKVFEVCGRGPMNEGKLRKSCRLFKKRRTNMHEEERSEFRKHFK